MKAMVSDDGYKVERKKKTHHGAKWYVHPRLSSLSYKSLIVELSTSLISAIK